MVEAITEKGDVQVPDRDEYAGNGVDDGHNDRDDRGDDGLDAAGDSRDDGALHHAQISMSNNALPGSV
jgi:hypothetical protein